MFRFASSKSVSLRDIHSQNPRQSLFCCCHITYVSQSRCALVLLLLFLASVKPGSRWSTGRRIWIRIAGITWNWGKKEKLCCIFELFSGTMLSCHSEPFLSLSVVGADSQVRVGGRWLRSLCWKLLMKKGEICVQAKKTWAGLWNSLTS